MKNSWKHTAQRVMSLILSFILTLTLITPTLAAGEVYDNDTDTTPPTGELQTPPTPEDEAADEDDPTAITPFSLMTVGNPATVDVWDKTANTEWYNEESSVFEISTAAQLAGLAQLVNSGNSFSGKTIKLTADIRLNSEDVPVKTDSYTPNNWTPIGTATNPFKGNVSGRTSGGIGFRYCSISNLAGDLFGVVDGGRVEYVQLITGTGKLVDTLKSGSTVTNCMSTSSAGLVGTNSGTVSACYCYDTTSKKSVVGTNHGTVTNCFYLADTSTFGEESDTGARTAEEFAKGRVAYELGYNWQQGEGKPSLGSNQVYQLTLKKASDAPTDVSGNVSLSVNSGGGVLVDESTGIQYYYGSRNQSCKFVPQDIEKGYIVSYSPAPTWPSTAADDDEGILIAETKVYTYTLIKADISWYIGSKDAPKYTLTTKEQLIGLSHLVNGTAGSTGAEKFSGKTICLGKDINLADYNWTPIGDTNHPFYGTFDGNDHTITLAIRKENAAGGTLAGFIGDLRGTVKNLHVAGEIAVTVDQSANTGIYIGGIAAQCGSGSNLVEKCQSSVSITVTYNGKNSTAPCYIGGIVGSCSTPSFAIKKCLNEGNIFVTANANTTIYAGGIIGQGKNGNPVSCCWNTGEVELEGANGLEGNIGGIVGATSNVTNCANYGAVTAPSNFEGKVGGILGSPYSKKNNIAVANSYNLGNVTGGTKTNGISNKPTRGILQNSYCICKVNGTETKQYIESGTNSANITYNAATTTYMVGEDTLAVKLVDKLNDNRDSNTPWFVNYDKYVYAPIHVLTWKGEKDERFEGTVVTVTYDPNGGINKDGKDTPVPVAVTLSPDTTTGEVKAEYEILSATAEELGFKHENGNIKSTEWNTEKNGDGTDYSGTITLTEDLTLYAQWTPVWEGDGTIGDPYQLKNKTDLESLQKKVNDEGFNYAGKWFKLTSDINLNNTAWTPIGTKSHPFSGSLNGGDKTISGLNVSITDGQRAGLFGYVNSPVNNRVTMKNLALCDGIVTITSGTSWCGGLVAQVNGGIKLDTVTVENLTVSGGTTGGTGGLIGGGVADLTNCHNKGGTVAGDYAGGLTGRGATSNGENFEFVDCTNSAAVTGTKYAGGMTGCEGNGVRLNCENSGTISCPNGKASGIAAGGTEFHNCCNKGNVDGFQASGITDYATTLVEKCSNSGPVKGKTTACGIARVAQRIEFCHNEGTVQGGNESKSYGIAESVYWWIRYCFTYNKENHVILAPVGIKDKVTCSYYLANKADELLASAGEWASETDFRCGKVAWGVDGGVGNHQGWWTQDEGAAYPKLLDEANKSKSYYRAKVSYGTGGTAVLNSRGFDSADQDDAVYGPEGTSVTVTATPYDDTFALKSLKLDRMSSRQFAEIENGSSFVMSQANAEVVAAFTGGGTGGGGGTGSGGEGQGDGNGEGDGSGSEEDTGLQSGSNPDVEYDVKNLVLSAYGAWGAEGSGKAFVQWLQSNAQTLRNLVTNSLDNMAGAARGKSSGDAAATAAALPANLNTYCGVDSKSATSIGRALQQYLDSASTDSFTGWLTSGSGMASGTVEAILTQYTESLLALTDRLYTKWESSGTSMTFPQWLDAQQVSMENLSESAQEPEQDTTNDPQTTDAPEDVPDGQESEGGSAGGGNSIWAVIGDAVRQNPIIVWSIVAAIVAIVAVGAVRRYHKVKKDERDDK